MSLPLSTFCYFSLSPLLLPTVSVLPSPFPFAINTTSHYCSHLLSSRVFFVISSIHESPLFARSILVVGRSIEKVASWQPSRSHKSIVIRSSSVAFAASTYGFDSLPYFQTPSTLFVASSSHHLFFAFSQLHSDRRVSNSFDWIIIISFD